MRYDLRINNCFWRTIEGIDLADALSNAGLDVDYTETGTECGYLHYDRADLAGLRASDETMSDELGEIIATAEPLKMTFGPEE